MTSQLLAGAVVTVAEDRGDWLHVRSADEYDGWMHVGYLTPTIGTEALWRVSLGAVVRDSAGASRALPLGARLTPGDTVTNGDVVEADALASRFPRDGRAIAQSAETLFNGASYLWGGGTAWGCDCSGFVQSVYALHGVLLPRDAWQQALVGEESDTGVATANAARLSANTHDDSHYALVPGDLLFFSDRDDERVTHVGVALDGDRMVHSSLRRGGVAIEQWHADDSYVARLRQQCVAVRRVV
jgi:cell wall-associated NlpC family hydrolase